MSAWCGHGPTLALGGEAPERRAAAVDGLRRMVEHLRRAAAEDLRIDDARAEVNHTQRAARSSA